MLIFCSTYFFSQSKRGWLNDVSNCVNLTVQDLLRQDARIQDLYLNISEMKLPITSLFSVQIMSYLGASDITHSDVNDSFISEIF